MDHTVYLDREEGDLEVLRSGRKTMIALGMNEKNACGSIGEGDVLDFVLDADREAVRARATAARVICSPPLTMEACMELMAEHSIALALTRKQVGELVTKKYIVLIELRDLRFVEPEGMEESMPEDQQTENFVRMDAP